VKSFIKLLLALKINMYHLPPFNEWTVYIISLPHQTDRRQHNIDQMKKLGVQWNFFDAKKPQDIEHYPHLKEAKKLIWSFIQGHIGCALSHYALWEKVAEVKDDKPVLILEDDTTFTDWVKHLHELPIPEDWDVLFTGHVPFVHHRNHCSRIAAPAYKRVVPVPGSPHVFRFDKSARPIGAWSYFIRPNSAHRFVQTYRLSENVDVFLSNQPAAYGITPSAFLHCDPFKSNTETVLGLSSCEAPLVPLVLFLVLGIACVTLYLIAPDRTKKIKVVLPLLVTTWLGELLSVGWWAHNMYHANCKRIISRDKVQKLRMKARLTDSKEHTQNLHGYRFHYTSFEPFTSVWTPESVKVVQKLLTQLAQQGPVWLCRGSLLGHVRHGGSPVPWHDRITVMMQMDKQKTVSRLGFRWPFVTVFPIHILNTNQVKVDNVVYNSAFPIPATQQLFCGVPVLVPDNVEEWLKVYPEWKTHYLTSKFDHRLNRKIDKRFVTKVAIKNLPVL
jgi:GR25 family glycosyltransferase involved in LPS biosynthesis